MTGDTNKVVNIHANMFTNNLNKYEFYIRGIFKAGKKGATTKFSDKIVYQVVCGSEVISVR